METVKQDHDAVKSRIGSAWRAHRDGNHSQAISEFEAILHLEANNIDVHYGLGLAQKAAGQHAAAKSNFEQALILTDKAEQNRRINAAAAGERNADGVEWNNPDDDSSDHHMMLKRMIGQRLDELKKTSA
jgi:tetratricopeptide (TPR) repeat protein